MPGKKTVIITGAWGGIGAGLVARFLEEGYNVVATSRNANAKLTASRSLAVSCRTTRAERWTPGLPQGPTWVRGRRRL